jgi:predicted DsbA family dithiol-disulfide isomerase
LRQEYDIEARWTAFPLHPETPREGITLEELFAGRPINIEQVREHLARVAAELGLPFGKREKTYNSRLAQEVGKLAEKQGYGEQFHMGNSVGLPGDHVRDALENRTYKEAVDQDWRRSYQMGVTAVPTFMMNGMSLVGAQPYEKLVQLMENCGVKPRV